MSVNGSIGNVPNSTDLSATEQGSPLEIVYQDESLVAINKPAGLLVHRSRIDVRATEFALQRLRDQIQQSVFPVHRIDRPTSGVLLFALDSKIAAAVAKQFEQRTVEKSYHAIVRGFLPENGCWDEPLVEKHDRIVDRKAQKNKAAQPATTQFRLSWQWEIPFSAGKYPTSRYSLATIRPLTGRKHQIRRHFNHMAPPDYRRHDFWRPPAQSALYRTAWLSSIAIGGDGAKARPSFFRKPDHDHCRTRRGV